MQTQQAWGNHVVRWASASRSDRAAAGEGFVSQAPVFLVTDQAEGHLAREVSWMILDAFSALGGAHPDGPTTQQVHDLWRDMVRGISRMAAESTILAGNDVRQAIDEVHLAGLIATYVGGEPTWIAVCCGSMDLLSVDISGRVHAVSRADNVGYDLPGDLWTIPMEAGQRFVVATSKLRASLEGTRSVPLAQFKRAERAASAVIAQPTESSQAQPEALLVVDVLSDEDVESLASPPTLLGEQLDECTEAPHERLSSSWGLEALGVKEHVSSRKARRGHLAPPALDDFAFVSYLGSGGFSDVYLYEEQLPKRLVAIKVLSPASLGEGGSSRFHDEVDLMAQLSGHPSVVTIHDADVAASGQPYVVMQYCPMPSLAERIAEGAMPFEDVLKMGVQIAGAVHTAHVMGIVHHDLKPANVLYSQFGRPLLGDFGIASIVGSGREENLGASLPWAAPEVLRQEAAGPAADVYSLAATVYTALVGQAPVVVKPHMTRREYIEAAIAGEREWPAQRWGAYSEAADAVKKAINSGMAHDVHARTPSAAQFGRDLQAIQRSLGLQPTDLEIPQV